MKSMKAKDYNIWTSSGSKSINKIINLFKNVFWYFILEMHNEKILPGRYAFFIPNYFKTQRVRDEAVASKPYMLGYVPDQYKTQGICIKAVGGRLITVAVRA